MKIFLLTFFIGFILINSSFSQEKKYTTFTIGRFTLEKFPAFYYKKPFKTITQRVPIIGKIALYQDIDQYGQNDGLRVEMQTDYVSPHTIYYYKKGVVVYTAYFFPNSLKANEIINKNLEDREDGPQIKRHMENGKLIQEIKTFRNGEDLTNQGINSPDKLSFDAQGFLDGPFVWTAKLERLNGKLQYSGIAKGGVIQKLIINSTLGERYDQFKCIYENKDDIITENRTTTSGDNFNSSKKILAIFKITNRKEVAENGTNVIYYQDIISNPYGGGFQPNYFEDVIIKMTKE